MARQDIQAGDTFKDARAGRKARLTIMEVLPGDQFFQLRWSDRWAVGPRRYVSYDHLQEIISGADPISRDFKEISHEIEHFDPEELEAFDDTALIPAESVAAHVHKLENGALEIHYYAWADVWDVPMDVEPRALRNEVTGVIVFEDVSASLPAAVAALISRELYPYRMSSDTRITAHLFPAKPALLDRIRIRFFGGPSFIPNDDLTDALEGELQALAKAAPAREETVLLSQAA